MIQDSRFKKGFTIFFATLVGSLALAIGVAIYDLTIRELVLSSTANESQYAIYAADAGAECALYWDLKCPTSGGPAYCGTSGGSAFATSSLSSEPSSGIFCNTQDIAADGTPTSPYSNPSSTWGAWAVVKPVGQGMATTTFTVAFPPYPYCATVEVGKSGSPVATSIISHGFNTCYSSGQTRLERVLQVTY